MKKLSALLCLSLLLTGCSSLNRSASNLIFPPYPNSDQRQGETVTLTPGYKDQTSYGNKLDTDGKCMPSEDKLLKFSALLPLTGASAIEFVTDQVQQFLKEETKRYTGSYSAVVVGDHFYTSCAPSKDEVHLESLTLTRSINNVGKVMELSFGIKPTIDGTAFQIIPRTILMKQSKAKITAFDISKPFGFDILAPWTIFKLNSLNELSPLRPNKVDITAEVSVTAVWIDKNRKSYSQLIASRKFKFGDITLSDDPEPKSLPYTPQLFPTVPRSVLTLDTNGNPKLLGPGNFIISIIVTEYDDYAERVMELEQGVDKNRDNFIERLTNVF